MVRVRIFCNVLLVLLASGHASAQTASGAAPYPNRAIRIVVGFAAGAINDLTVRSIAPGLSERLGQPVVVDNKPGAGGLIAAEHVAKSVPDGYTLLLAPTSTMAVNPAVYSKLSYDPQRDFAPVSMIGNAVLSLTVNAELPVRSLAELVAYARANPDKANYGAMATGFEVITAALTARAGVRFETIQFKSTAETMLSLLNGQIMIAYQDFNSLNAQLKTGKVRALVGTGSRRTSDLPEVPTFPELGYPDLTLDSITGIVVRRGTPDAIIARLEKELMLVMKQPDVVERWRVLGLSPVGTTAAEYSAVIDKELGRWVALAKQTNFKLD